MRFALLVALLAIPAQAADRTDTLLARAWPYAPYARLTELGNGVAVVFSPDLSVPGNCRFYRALGFACFDDPDWSRVLDGIRDYNLALPDRSIRTVILETHGTNGNGLKLQRSYDPDAERSYISAGALQERLEPEGIRYIIISACNSGRLLRPAIYRNLDPAPYEKLFLPATCGIIGAASEFNPGRSRVTIITPASSHIEMTVIGNVKELAPAARRLLVQSAEKSKIGTLSQFAVSDLMMQMITRHPALRLRVGAGLDAFSRRKNPEEASEALFRSFRDHLAALARREPTAVFASGQSR
ncbi:MAG TPA: hypothetical protein VLV78_01845 [Thermoanaerobaculia bacterium]|nr:hypothetical protein [Thermoanaerobaculia bacterium]